jgi:hypothetical protein
MRFLAAREPPTFPAGLLQEHIRAVYELLRPDTLPCQSQNQLTLLAVGLSGLFVLSDWIGSAERWFEYTAPIAADGTFELYWRRAQAAAKVAVDQACVSSAPVREFSGISEFISEGRTPSPVQSFAATAPLPNGPSLIIVEDVTGSGKTEAAMIAAQLLLQAVINLVAGQHEMFVKPPEPLANADPHRNRPFGRQYRSAKAAPQPVVGENAPRNQGTTIRNEWRLFGAGGNTRLSGGQPRWKWPKSIRSAAPTWHASALGTLPRKWPSAAPFTVWGIGSGFTAPIYPASRMWFSLATGRFF